MWNPIPILIVPGHTPSCVCLDCERLRRPTSVLVVNAEMILQRIASLEQAMSSLSSQLNGAQQNLDHRLKALDAKVVTFDSVLIQLGAYEAKKADDKLRAGDPGLDPAYTG